ncbi:RCC1/BLIP-II [Schizophyllum commune H4-8]|uniref:RCC1/BLIP-II n=1 Tax=Schizophyllum commune (strain H4-8 / FGSC 9210) TaxID=578458 RepID=UPI002160E152|nr:RCC1/BLIP-II [Schizophyllum commune H4-8]KAI5891209.1 RCC1/BLIP-II [Schizophyllum commune H4-8]
MAASDRRLLAAGSNARGQLGICSTDDSHSFVPASFSGHPESCIPSSPISISGGANHTLALLEGTSGSPELWGAGDGSCGHLGPNIKPNTTVFQRIRLRGLKKRRCRLMQAAWETSYAVFSADGQPDVLISMGGDDFGDLGVGKGKNLKTIPRTGYHIVKLDHLLEDVDGNTLRVDWLTAGPHHVVLRLSANHRRASHRKAIVVGWGACRHGQLGDVASEGSKTPTFIDTPRVIFHDNPNDPIEQCAAGHHHTVMLRRSGAVLAFGSDRKGQLAGIHGRTGVKAIGCTWHGTYIVEQDNTVRGTGSNIHGQLGMGHATSERVECAAAALPPTDTHRLFDLACGSEHIIARLETSGGTEAWGWGWNEHGNLGTGSLDDVDVPKRIWPKEGDTASEVRGIWAGLATI